MTASKRPIAFIVRVLIVFSILLSALGFPNAPAAASSSFSLDRPNPFSSSLLKPYYDAVPGVTTNLPAEGMVGEPVSFNVLFDNTGDAPGYGPYMDVIFPETGMDGDDGLFYISASLAGFTLSPAPVSLVFPAGTGCVDHPYARTVSGNPVQVCGTPGDRLVVVLLPFGSFVPDQPASVINFTAQISPLADVGSPLTVRIGGGYQFGSDPLDNPTTDPSLVSGYSSVTITPTILTLRKVYSGPEDETATGPNYPRRYTVIADIAASQTITNFDLSDKLPVNMQYLSTISTNPASSPLVTPSTTAPDSTLTQRFASVTGSAGSNDAEMVFEYYIPFRDLSGGFVVPPVSGDDQPSIDDARASGLWTPIDPRDTPATVTSDLTTNDHTLADRSIAIQKTGAPVSGTEYRRGVEVEYTLDFQISDYFGFDAVSITDTLPDGLHIATSYAPVMEIEGNRFSLPAAAMATTNVTVIPNYTPADPILPNDGTTQIIFNVSNELLTRGQPNGWLVGGCVPVTATMTAGGTGGADPDCTTYNNGATTGRIRFRAVIQSQFTDTYLPGDADVDQGDVMTNTVSVTGSVLSYQDLTPTGQSETDGSAHTLQIARGSITKSIYAVNGSTSFPSNPVQVAPGDTVTYRITYSLPTANVENLHFIDFLPLPIFASSEVATFTATVSATVPDAGYAHFGPTDTFYNAVGIVPTLTTNVAENSVTFDYGNAHDPLDQPRMVDLLFTVTVNNQPFADKLFLTNQAEAHEGSTNAGSKVVQSIIQIQLTEPVLTIRKGVISSDRPSAALSPSPAAPVTIYPTGSASGACPRFDSGAEIVNSAGLGTLFTSDLSGVDAGDAVTFAIVVENQGTGRFGAYDIQIRDVLPSGFTYVTNSICVTDGTGAVIPFTGDLFATTGIELTDPGPTTDTGALDAYDENNGRNIALITFDALLNTPVSPNTTYTNEGLLTHYAGVEGGANHVPTPRTDSADVTTLLPSAQKTITATGINDSTNNNLQAVIGESINYQVTLTIPEGTITDTVVIDTLDNGLAFVDCLGITSSVAVTTDLPGGFAAACNDPANPTVSADKRTITFDLANLTNSDVDNSATETITLTYQVVVENRAINQQNTTLNNNVVLQSQGASLTSASAPLVTVLEPVLQTVKTVQINGAAVPPATAQAGDTVRYDIVLSHAVGSPTSAYDVTFADTLPYAVSESMLLSPVLTVTDSDGILNASNFALSGSDAAGWTVASTAPFDFPYSAARSITLTVTGTLSTQVILGTTITNRATSYWTSLPSTYPDPSQERTGSGTAPNDYYATGTITFPAINPEGSKVYLGSDQAHTADPRVTIGEIVSYTVTFVIYPGTASSTVIQDTLPAGMAFVQCLDVTADPALTSSLGFSCTNAAFSSGGANPEDAGRVMTVDLGTVVNPTASPRTGTITYSAQVLNSPSAYAGRSLVNSALIRIGATNYPFPATTTLTVVEPSFTIAKTFSPTTGDGGNTVTITVTVTNGNAATVTNGMDVIWRDTVPSGMTYVPGSLANVSGLAATLDDTSSPLLTASWTDFPANTNSVLRFQATVSSTVAPSQSIVNVATVTYTSLPGSVTTTQTTQNPYGCERTGGADCGTNHSYLKTGNATYTITNPAVAKVLTDTSASHTAGSNVTIGEVITYTITVTLPDGISSPSVTVTDNLPTGLAYVAGSAVVDSSTFIGTIPSMTVTCAGGNGDDPVFSFATITVDSTENSTNNAFTIRFNAVVLNVAGNTTGTTLTNRAQVRVGSGTTYNSGNVNATVVQPNITINKRFLTAFDTVPDTITDDKAAVNDVAMIYLVVTNTGNATAFDVNVVDTLPVSIFGDLSNITEVTTPVGFTFSSATIGSGHEITYSGGSINSAQTLVFAFTAKVATITTGQTFNNSAYVSDSSTLPGSDPNERHYAATGTDRLTGIAVDLTITKDDYVTQLYPGQVATYTFIIQNVGERDADGATITDTIATGTSFVGGAGWACAGVICTYGPFNLAAGATTSTTLSVQMDDPLASSIDFITNTASVTDDGSHGADANPANNATYHVDLADAAPDLSSPKTSTLVVDDGDGFAEPGEVLEYTILVTNHGNQDATSVIFMDTPGANTNLVTGSVSVSPFGTILTGNTAGDTTVTVDLGSMAGLSASTATIKFRVTIVSPLPAGVTQVQNQGTVNSDGTPFPTDDPEEPGSTDPTVDPVLAAPDLVITKTDGGITAVPGDVVTYTLSYNNIGNQHATGAAVTETVPLNTAYNAAGSTAGWVCSGGGAAGQPCVYTIGNLNVGSSGTLSFAVQIDPSLPAGVTEITNVVFIADDGTNGVDPNLTNNTATETTPVTAEPLLTLSKTDGVATATPGQTLTYVLTITNTGDQGATNVTLTDTIPLHTSFVSTSDGGSFATATRQVSWPLFNLPSSTAVTRSVTVLVDPTIPADVTAITNLAFVTDDGANSSQPSTATATDTDNLLAAANLEIIKTSPVATVFPGDTVTYTLQVSNTGDRDAVTVTVTESIPTGTTHPVEAGWACLGTSCVSDPFDLLAGAVSTLSFTLVIDDPIATDITTITNLASAVDGNNTTSTNTAETVTVVASYSITATKTSWIAVDDGDGQLEPGETLQYQIILTNSGDRDAADLTLTDVPDANTLLVTGTVQVLPSGTVLVGNTAGDTSVTVQIPYLSGRGGTASILFQVDIVNPFPIGVTEVVNQGFVSFESTTLPTDDPEEPGSTDPTVDPVLAAPDLLITKTDGGVTVQPGDSYTYTIFYTNVGNQAASGVTLTETIPAYTTADLAASDPGWTCPSGVSAGSVCELTVGALSVGSSGTVTLTVTVDSLLPSGVSTLYNYIVIADDGTNGVDPTPENNTAAETTPVAAAPSLLVTKTSGLTQALPGQVVTYTLTVSNNGNQTAANVALNDTLPTLTTFISASDMGVYSTLPHRVDWPLFDLPASQTITRTVVIQLPSPAPSGLSVLANVTFVTDDGSNESGGTPSTSTATETIPVIAEPVLVITKDDGVTQVAPGAEVTYTITVTNTGTQEAANVLLTDNLPAELIFISASDGGTYASLTHTITWPLFNLPAQGAPIQRTVHAQVSPLATETSVVNIAIVHDDGSNASQTITAGATDTDLIGESSKVISGTSHAGSILPNVLVGEMVTYTVTLNVGTGTVQNLTLTDVLGPGLAFMNCTSITGASLTSSLGSLGTICATPQVTSEPNPDPTSDPANRGRRVTFNFGSLTNASSEFQLLTVTYEAVVLNSAANVRGSTLDNAATWNWTGGSQVSSAPALIIIEPAMTVSKTADVSEGFQGNAVVYTVVVSPAAQGNADAYDVEWVDTLPAGLVYVSNTLQFVSGVTPTVILDSGAPTLRVRWDVYPMQPASATIIQFTATIGNVSPGALVTNRVDLSWSSLPGNETAPQSPHNQLSTERFYQPSSTINNYGSSSQAVLTITSEPKLPATGFAPGFRLPAVLPPGNPLVQYSDLVLEIPRLGVSMPIVGVPLVDGAWDLSWLNREAGYLQGTAFPTWAGNSVLTAHVYDRLGLPGPFYQLDQLKWGDWIIIRAYGQMYVYQVRQTYTVGPDDSTPLQHKDLPWITLITCKGYDKAADAYKWRVAVQAVLISVTEE